MRLNRGYHRWSRIIQWAEPAVENGIHHAAEGEFDRAPCYAFNALSFRHGGHGAPRQSSRSNALEFRKTSRPFAVNDSLALWPPAASVSSLCVLCDHSGAVPAFMP